MNKEMKNASRLLSQVLRHAPEKIGIKLDPQGWVAVDNLLECLAVSSHPISRDDLEEIVRTSDKKRFTLSDDGARIRAAQGHSVTVELDLAEKQPPQVLFHGTASKNLEAIMSDGLKPGSRQQVHLSTDRDTAIQVGQRHGKPVVLILHAAAMSADGAAFYQADNGVWLTDYVPPKYLKNEDEPAEGGHTKDE